MKKELIEISTKYSKSELSLSEFNLTEKQLKIIDWICEGRTNKEIANKISITESTVKYHIKTIYDLLQVSGRSELREKINKNS
jgi:DNA-binding CsgD family transcriptional regulator